MADHGFEDNVKSSFSRVREHILLLEKEVKANRDFIIKQNEQIKFLLEHLSRQLSENEAEKAEISPNEAVSSGNKGVYSNIHSFTIHSFNSHSIGIHPLAIPEGKDDIEEDFEAKSHDAGNDVPKEEGNEDALEEDDDEDDDEPEEAIRPVSKLRAVPLNFIGEYLKGIAKAQIDEPKAKPQEEENAVPKPSSEAKEEAVPAPAKAEAPKEKAPALEQLKPAEDTKAEGAKAPDQPKVIMAKPIDEPKPVQARLVAEEDKKLGAKSENLPTENENYSMFHKRPQPQKIKSFATFQGLKREIEETFDRLSKQELLTFLTIYQLEDDMNNVSYTDVAEKLKLSEGCIRTYISSLIRKGVPVEKKKFNNKLVLLSVPKEFRELNLKKQLMANYYRADPYQPTLKESF